MSSAYEFGKLYGQSRSGQQFNPATQPLSAQQGNVNYDEVSDVVKTPLKGLMWLLDTSNKYVTRPTIGAATRVEASKPFQAIMNNPVGNAAVRAANLAAQGPILGSIIDPMSPEQAARIRKGVSEGASFSDTFEQRFEGNGLGKFAAEAVYDPLNLVGGGAGAARAAGMGAKGVGRISKAEDLLNAAQSAPITVPLKGARKAINKFVPGVEQKSSTNLFRTQSMDFENVADVFDELGLEMNLNQVGNLQRMPEDLLEVALTQADERQAEVLIRGTDNIMLSRIFPTLAETDNRHLGMVTEELQGRGLLTKSDDGGWVRSGRLRAHEEMDRISDVMGHGADEREAWRDTIDLTAFSVWNSNKDKFAKIDDVYDMINLRSYADDIPPETGTELFARLDRNDQKVADALAKLETKENIAELLGDNRVENAGIWNWYPRGAELLYSLGFDHSRAFTDEQAQWLFEQPGMQEVTARMGMDPAATLDRLKNISKIETVTQLIGAGSMNEGPTRNLYNSLNAYRYILEGRNNPFEGFGQIVETKPGSGKATIRTPRTEEERSAFDLAYKYSSKAVKERAEKAFQAGREYVTQPGDLIVSGQTSKGYAALAHPEGLLQDAYLRKAAAGKATFGGQESYVHDDVDKMYLFAEVLKEETDAFAAYQAAIRNGDSHEVAEALRNDIRAQIKGYVSDIWDQRGTMSLEGRLTDDLIEKGIPTNYKALATRPTTTGGWFALKSFVHEDLFPYLTGRMPGGGEVPQGFKVHPDADWFRKRYVNPAALQADLWARFRFRDKTAVEPALKLMAGERSKEVAEVLAEKGPDGVRQLFGDIVFGMMENPEYGRGLKEFTDDSQDFLAVASKESNTFSNKEAVSRIAPQIRTGEGYQTASGEILPYAPDEVVDAMIQGNYEPLMQMMGDSVKQGMFNRTENGVDITFYPQAGMSTPVHELMGHTTRALSGGQQAADIRRSVGQPVYKDPPSYGPDGPVAGGLSDTKNQARMPVEAEEQFARGVETTVREGVPTNLEDAEKFGRMRKFMELEYMRQQGLDVPRDDYMSLYTDPTVSRPDVDARVMSKVQNGTASGQDLRRVLRSGQYGTISARTTEAADDPALISKTNQLRSELESMGYTPYEAAGIYKGDAEPSFLVPNLSREDALKLGRKYGQESVLLGREGFVYMDGSDTLRITQDPPIFDPPEDDFFTAVKMPDGTEVRFNQPMDWDGTNAGFEARQKAYENTQFSDPLEGSSVREVIDQLAMSTGRSVEDSIALSDELTTAMEPIFKRNPQAQAVQMWSHPAVREPLLRAMEATNPEQRAAALSEAQDAVGGMWASFGQNHPIAGKLVNAILPKDQRASVIVDSTAFGRSARGSRLSTRQMDTLENARSMENMQKFEDAYTKNYDAVDGIISEMAKTNPLVKTLDSQLTTYGDLHRYAEMGDERQKKIIKGFLNEYDIPNIDLEDAKNLTLRAGKKRNLIIEHQKGLAKQLGIDYNKTPQGLKALANRATNTWREQALLSLRYHMANGLDMTVKSAIFGINPLVPRGAASEQARMLGRSIPRGVRVETYGPRELTGLPEEFKDMSDDSNLPGPLGSLSKQSRRLARAMENAVREAAWAQGVRDNLQRNMPAFESSLRRELGTNADGIITDLRKSLHGVSFSSQDVSQLIVNRTGDARAASRAASIWERQLDDAFTEGTGLSNLVHFDFGDERLIEEKLKLRSWAPFHFWATRNIPFYLDTLAAHPGIMRRWQDYNDASEEFEEEEGLPGRFKGMVPLPGPADKVLDTLFGPGRSLFNPMVVLSIADQAKPRYQDTDQPMLGQLLDKAAYVGLAPAPWFSYPLSILGAYGPDDEQMPVLRHSDIVKNATGLATGTGGLDVEAPLRAVTNRAREIATGKEVQTVSGSAYKDYQISKRLAEMSIEQTGYANHPAFTAAMREPNDPLYKEAEKRVQKDNLLTGLQHFVTPVPHKRISDTEQLVRDRQGVMPEGAMADRDFRDRLVQSGDPAGAYLRTPKPKILEPVKQDQYGNVQGQGQGSASGGGSGQPDPTVWGGGVWGPDRPPPFNNPTVFQGYIRKVQKHGFVDPAGYIQMISR